MDRQADKPTGRQAGSEGRCSAVRGRAGHGRHRRHACRHADRHTCIRGLVLVQHSQPAQRFIFSFCWSIHVCKGKIKLWLAAMKGEMRCYVDGRLSTVCVCARVHVFAHACMCMHTRISTSKFEAYHLPELYESVSSVVDTCVQVCKSVDIARDKRLSLGLDGVCIFGSKAPEEMAGGMIGSMCEPHTPFEALDGQF